MVLSHRLVEGCEDRSFRQNFEKSRKIQDFLLVKMYVNIFQNKLVSRRNDDFSDSA